MRFVSVRLPEGQLEVLVTTLLDERNYPTEEFSDLYHRRWGHETFYNRLKSRLDLENFSGQTVEAVRQDFHAAVLLCNLERLLTQPASEAVAQASAGHQHAKQVNRADSYHALKDQVLDLLYSDLPAEKVIGKLQRLFVVSGDFTTPLLFPAGGDRMAGFAAPADVRRPSGGLAPGISSS